MQAGLCPRNNPNTTLHTYSAMQNSLFYSSFAIELGFFLTMSQIKRCGFISFLPVMGDGYEVCKWIKTQKIENGK